MWAPPDAHVAKDAHSIILFREYYASRSWGRRKFNKTMCKPRAASLISSLVRGFLARQQLRHYFCQRYSKMMCLESGYFYFIDNLSESGESSWHKPRLAFPLDIIPYKKPDPEDYMSPNDKYSYGDRNQGPYVKRTTLGKKNVIRVSNTAFKPYNPWRDIAINKHEDVDLEKSPLGSVIYWLEDIKLVSFRITEYAQMRAAITNNNWSRVLFYMDKEPDNLMCQLYGYFSFSKSEIPLDTSGLLDFAAAEVLVKGVAIIQSNFKKYGSTLKLFVLYALQNIFATKPGRAEHFSIMNVIDVGEGRTSAIENLIRSRIIIFNKYLVNVETENVQTSTNKGTKDFVTLQIPTQRAADIVEQVFICLGSLSQEPEYREQMALITADAAIQALIICEDVPAVILRGLRYLYNLCYRCESGQEALLNCDVHKIVESSRRFHSGDVEIMKQIRRLEVALTKDGWRGNAEDIIDKEMKGMSIEKIFKHGHGDKSGLRGIIAAPSVEKHGTAESKKTSTPSISSHHKSDSDNHSISSKSSNKSKTVGFKSESKDAKNSNENADDDVNVQSDLTES